MVGLLPLNLTDRVAVVTGSGRGLGKAIALALAEAGARVTVSSRSPAEIEATAAEITEKGGIALTVAADVRNKQQVVDLMEATVAEFGRIDILVNNAGTRRPAPLLEMSEDDWDEVVDTNLKGAFLCTQAAAKYMMQQKYGKIINISSVAGRGWTEPGGFNYASSKGGLIQLTKACARTLGPYGINVNAIAPGAIETTLVLARRTPEQAQKYLEYSKKAAILGRLGTVQDIANLVLFLASNYSSFITGQVIPLDGGRTDRM